MPDLSHDSDDDLMRRLTRIEVELTQARWTIENRSGERDLLVAEIIRRTPSVNDIRSGRS